MARRKRKLWYTVTVDGWWWCAPLGSWIRSTDLNNFNDLGYSSHRNLMTKKNAIKAFYSAPIPTGFSSIWKPEVVLSQTLIKNGKHWERIWVRIE